MTDATGEAIKLPHRYYVKPALVGVPGADRSRRRSPYQVFSGDRPTAPLAVLAQLVGKGGERANCARRSDHDITHFVNELLFTRLLLICKIWTGVNHPIGKATSYARTVSYGTVWRSNCFNLSGDSFH